MIRSFRTALLAVAAVATFASARAGDDTKTGKDALGDWTTDAPGVRRKITMADLAKPFDTPSSNNGPKVVKRPEGAWPKAPKGFEVTEYATGLTEPRVIARAPNGDLFVSESRAGRRTSLERGHLRPCLVVDRQHEHRGAEALAAEEARQLQAVHPGEHEVEEDDVEAARLDVLQACLGRTRPRDLEAPGMQVHLDHGADEVVVLDEQHASLGGHVADLRGAAPRGAGLADMLAGVGSVRVNRAPQPQPSLVATRSPPISRARDRAMGRPSPVP